MREKSAFPSFPSSLPLLSSARRRAGSSKFAHSAALRVVETQRRTCGASSVHLNFPSRRRWASPSGSRQTRRLIRFSRARVSWPCPQRARDGPDRFAALQPRLALPVLDVTPNPSARFEHWASYTRFPPCSLSTLNKLAFLAGRSNLHSRVPETGMRWIRPNYARG